MRLPLVFFPLAIWFFFLANYWRGPIMSICWWLIDGIPFELGASVLPWVFVISTIFASLLSLPLHKKWVTCSSVLRRWQLMHALSLFLDVGTTNTWLNIKSDTPLVWIVLCLINPHCRIRSPLPCYYMMTTLKIVYMNYKIYKHLL